jgi:RNA polymerase sigma-70 factor, ECF subfamily
MDVPEPKPAEISRLLERIRSGDQEAVNRLFGHYRRHLVGMVNGRLDERIRSRLDASDVVQDALQEASRRLEGYLATEAVPFGLWLRQIAIDHLHKAWRRHFGTARRTVSKEMPLPDRSSLQLARQLVSGRSTPSQHLSRIELVERVRQAMARLPEIDQAVLEMRHFEDQPYEQIGIVLGLSADAARKQYVRALQRLGKLSHELGSSS